MCDKAWMFDFATITNVHRIKFQSLSGGRWLPSVPVWLSFLHAVLRDPARCRAAISSINYATPLPLRCIF